MTSTSIKYLRLFLHVQGKRRPIGYLSAYGDILRVSFEEDYIADHARPTLSMAYRGATEADTQAILRSSRDARVVGTGGHWPVYFQNLLPESHNRTRLASERHCEEDDEFELLAAAGRDLMGAVEVEPISLQEGIPDIIRHWHTTMGLDVLEPGFVEMPVEDATSLPGVVTKFSAVKDGRRYMVKRHGQAGSFILKLPTTAHPDLVANEYMGYQLCGAVGLTCAKATIITRDEAELPEQVPFNEILAVERFDRQGGRRIHMEEFAQVMSIPPKKKYGTNLENDYAAMLRIVDQLSSRPGPDVQEFVRRFVAFILMGNTDAHLKNWALWYPDSVSPQLAPLYDPVCVTAFFPGTQPNQYALNKHIDAKLSAFTWDDLSNLLKAANLARHSRLLSIAKDTVKQAQAVWPALLQSAPSSVRAAVLARLQGGVSLSKG